MTKKRILIVEDDQDINELLTDHLEIKGFDTDSVFDGKAAIEKIKEETYDLFILDWMLPEFTGLEICSSIRSLERFEKTPILFLTAKADQDSIIEALEAGANDYIKKPFTLAELTARVQVHFREYTKKTELIFESLKLNTTSYETRIDDSLIKLTKSEFVLLKILLESPNKVYSREELVKEIQGDDTIVTNRTVDTHMTGLRKKIGQYSNHIVTIRGVGYKFEKQ